MNKGNSKLVSKIISKTLIFIVVVALVSAFKSVFGPSNSTIGITTIILSLVLLDRDLTKRPFQNLIHLVIFNLILGIGSYISFQNLWLGLIINFVIMFSIGYIFSYELRKPVNMLFGLHYILMLSKPITLEELPMRLAALVFGAIFIMGVQVIINRNKSEKLGNELLKGVTKNIFHKINLIKQNKELDTINSIINSNINDFKLGMFDSINGRVYINRKGKAGVNILSCLEKINFMLDDISLSRNNVELLDDIYSKLKNVEEHGFDDSIANSMIKKYEALGKDIDKVNEVIATFKILNGEIIKYKSLQDEKETNLPMYERIVEKFKVSNDYRKGFLNINSNRTSYGVRLGLLVTVTIFIVNYFKIPFGIWIVYTVFALTQPYSEFAQVKSQKRIIGTIMGCIIAFILLNLTIEATFMGIITIFIGYLMGYVSDYKYMIMLSTIFSILSESVNTNDFKVVFIRFAFVSIGIILALVVNKFVLNRKYDDEKNKIIQLQEDIYNEMVKGLEKDDHVAENLVLMPALIEKRIDIHKLNIEKDRVYKNRFMINNIYFEHLIDEYKLKVH